MIKNLTGGAIINYGATLPATDTSFDGALFYKTGGADQGLYIFGFRQDANASQIGDQSVQGWSQVEFPSLYVDAAGDTMSGDLSLANPTLSINTNNITAVGVTTPLSFINNANFVWKKAMSGGSAEMMRLTDTGILQLAQNNVWQTVWHTGNDGAGSGLDADLLDGQNSNFFQNANNINTGTLNIARFPFMPVEQGGAGNTGNKVYIAWNGSQLVTQVDSTSFGSSWPISIRGSAVSAETAARATTADSATDATSSRFLRQGGSAGGVNMSFHWSGQSGQPTWLWGGNDGQNMYVYNPANFSVAYATTAGTISYNNVTGRPTQVSHLPNDAGYATTGSVNSSISTLNTNINNHITNSLNALLPRGSIIMWTGSSPPAGWLLCNGQNGTPNLMDRFIVGAGASYGVGAVGGNVTATSSWNGDHSHTTGWYGGFVPTGSVHDHALTVEQMPAHQHATSYGEFDSGKYGNVGARNQRGSQGTDYDNFEYLTSVTGNGWGHSHGLSMNAGGGHNHDTTTNGGHNHTMDVRPPFYALAFIMKA